MAIRRGCSDTLRFAAFVLAASAAFTWMAACNGDVDAQKSASDGSAGNAGSAGSAGRPGGAGGRGGTAGGPADAGNADVHNPLTNPEDGPPAGNQNPEATCNVPTEAGLEDVSNPTSVVGSGTRESCTSRAVVD